MKIEVFTDEVSSFTIEGRTYRSQPAWITLPTSPYPVEIRLSLRDGSAPYAPGVYALDLAKSLKVYKGKLGFGTLSLTTAPKA